MCVLSNDLSYYGFEGFFLEVCSIRSPEVCSQERTKNTQGLKISGGGAEIKEVKEMLWGRNVKGLVVLEGGSVGGVTSA